LSIKYFMPHSRGRNVAVIFTYSSRTTPIILIPNLNDPRR